MQATGDTVNGIHRIAFAIAGLATLTAVGGVFAAQGYIEAQQRARAAESAQAAEMAAAEAAESAAQTLPPLSTEIIYINPEPTPQVINVVQTAKPAPPTIVQVVVPAAGGEDEHEDEDEDEHEHEDDD
jgi:type II secretory pathway pseudopilin PulG